MHVMVPRSMHKEMLSKIHANHFGADSNIRMAREVLSWQGGKPYKIHVTPVASAPNIVDQPQRKQ